MANATITLPTDEKVIKADLDLLVRGLGIACLFRPSLAPLVALFQRYIDTDEFATIIADVDAEISGKNVTSAQLFAALIAALEKFAT